jgi:hypothetical protein
MADNTDAVSEGVQNLSLANTSRLTTAGRSLSMANNSILDGTEIRLWAGTKIYQERSSEGGQSTYKVDAVLDPKDKERVDGKEFDKLSLGSVNYYQGSNVKDSAMGSFTVKSTEGLTWN